MIKTPTDLSILRRRAGAYVCDQAIIWFGHTALCEVFFQTFKPTLENFPVPARNMVFDMLTDSSPTTFIICFLAYYLIAPWLGDGQTIGQRFFGLRMRINQRKKEDTYVPPYLEVSSYILRGMGLLFNQMFFGIPFILHFISKDGRGLQDWCSFSSLDMREECSQFSVIYAYHDVGSSEMGHGPQFNHATEEVQLTLQLDSKNPSIVQLYPVGQRRPSIKKAA